MLSRDFRNGLLLFLSMGYFVSFDGLLLFLAMYSYCFFQLVTIASFNGLLLFVSMGYYCFFQSCDTLVLLLVSISLDSILQEDEVEAQSCGRRDTQSCGRSNTQCVRGAMQYTVCERSNAIHSV